uniref:Uncharacterized protein n=1 Tax=Triticum urartu TaxID=4572 RepID=A0A8R7RBH6_TRIUA
RPQSWRSARVGDLLCAPTPFPASRSTPSERKLFTSANDVHSPPPLGRSPPPPQAVLLRHVCPFTAAPRIPAELVRNPGPLCGHPGPHCGAIVFSSPPLRFDEPP